MGADRIFHAAAGTTKCRDRKRAVVAVLVDALGDERSTTTYRGGPACGLIAEIGSAVCRALG